MKEFTFIDLFSGIGGFRKACEQEGGECVFSSEVNKHSCEIYEKNFCDKPSGDITKINFDDISDFDLLCAGFPCQSFSAVGKRLGFDDTRGMLIYEIFKILEEKKPRAFLLENVQGILNQDGGNAFNIIRKKLGKTFNLRREFFLNPNNLEYNIFYKVLNSADFGLAQNRKRLFIVGFRNDLNGWTKFKFPKGFDSSKVIADILEEAPNIKYFLSDKQIERLIKKDERNCIVCDNRKSWALLTGIGKSFRFNQNYLNINNKKSGSTHIEDLSGNMRIFTPRECARLQGFPEDFKIHNNDTQAYKQLGNAVSPPVIREIIVNIKKILKENK